MSESKERTEEGRHTKQGILWNMHRYRDLYSIVF